MTLQLPVFTRRVNSKFIMFLFINLLNLNLNLILNL